MMNNFMDLIRIIGYETLTELENDEELKTNTLINSLTRIYVAPFDSTIIPALKYAAKIWLLREQDERSLGDIKTHSRNVDSRSIPYLANERKDPKFLPYVNDSKIKDVVLHARISKIRWAGHVLRFNDNLWTRADTDWIPQQFQAFYEKTIDPMVRFLHERYRKKDIMLSQSLE
ncbi:hypothetical protein KIN20_003595 [Parelaphostrongylus tenuis]|uniref:Uncharacterized protein n=1 Tax=Parelaphostrongylus tenuis TaxID=148309 RepID=A0AAD5MIL1_PARTN|nr:hypothetical protein KIN20_003595 [Parelaphostrongylus tenuis]